MAAQTLEQKKQLYSRQLAAHTFRQWNAVCQNQPHEKKAEDDPRSRGPDIGLVHDDRQLKFGSDQRACTPEERSQGRGHCQSGSYS
ncbi:hypothetical protein BDZ94DRAFT_1268214 [Collybia nuda]|uniref:Uncharacterized protein n=1 Tax=Collybia nuda TaxID=64659 RepID=A0A9P5Y177_9AGAR|nr:hypothetical protein BDZ94DRAFT_1268214 [Collybia nuda]